ncbi:3'-5' exonuclease [Paracoccus onubensis]|uniref:3'-5' exonuclease n=1 Tax=Paracoccus onubensis TaxID=1675788 RepID=UPI00272EF45C|nr:3'-5' exonuclease [Paracoccus onubensis]MDP0929076.1 3'-5' exonuclease [Paracoccus onubensis]
MKRRVGLRLRVLLLFAGFAVLLLAGSGLSLWAEARRLPGEVMASGDTLDVLIRTGVIQFFGILTGTAVLWLLVDHHIVQPIEGLAGSMRTGRPPDVMRARYLGDLGPAIADAVEERSRTQEALDEAVAAQGVELQREKETLESIFADFGAGAIMADSKGRVIFYNAAAARFLPGLALDRKLSPQIAPAVIEAALARLETGAGATDLACLAHDGMRLSGRIRHIGENILLVLQERLSTGPAPHEALEALRRHAATLVPMLDALEGPIPQDLARAIRAEGQGLAATARQLTDSMTGGAAVARAMPHELVAGLTLRGDLPQQAVQAEAASMNALLRFLNGRLSDEVGNLWVQARMTGQSELHLLLEWAGKALPVDRLDEWLSERPDPGQPDLTGAEILAAHETGIWPESGPSGSRLVLPLQLMGATEEVAGLTYDFGLASRGASSSRLADLTCVVFDTETTGLEDSDRMVQIAGLRIARGRLTGESFETLVNPGRAIPPRATAIHGISDAMVADAPGPDMALTSFHHFAQDAVLVAHNAPFDMGMLRNTGKGPDFDNRVLDTVLLSVMIWGGSVSHTLDALAERLGIVIPPEKRHTAMGDARATAEIFLSLIPALEAKGITRFEDVRAEARKHRRLIRDVNGSRS